MLKFTGMLLLITAGSAAGLAAAARLSEKVQLLEQYLEFIVSAETDIRYTGRRINEIIENHTGAGIFSLYLKRCRSSAEQGVPFPDAWERTFSRASKDTGISKDEQRLICSFGRELGASDTDGQISHCRHHAELIKPFIRNACENRKTKGRLYGVLGTCLGAAAALMLI